MHENDISMQENVEMFTLGWFSRPRNFHGKLSCTLIQEFIFHAWKSHFILMHEYEFFYAWNYHATNFSYVKLFIQTSSCCSYLPGRIANMTFFKNRWHCGNRTIRHVIMLSVVLQCIVCLLTVRVAQNHTCTKSFQSSYKGK